MTLRVLSYMRVYTGIKRRGNHSGILLSNVLFVGKILTTGKNVHPKDYEAELFVTCACKGVPHPGHTESECITLVSLKRGFQGGFSRQSRHFPAPVIGKQRDEVTMSKTFLKTFAVLSYSLGNH